jgi:hypothetical protein
MQRQLKFLKGSAVSAGKTTCKQVTKMTSSNTWAAEAGCTSSFLHTKAKTSATIEKQQDAEEELENFSFCNLGPWFHLFQILGTYDIFSVPVFMLLHYFE